MPKKLDGALAPGARHQKSMIDISGKMEVLKDVYEDFRR